MKRLSKSRYALFCQCPKALWLKTNKPDEAVMDGSTEARFEAYNKSFECSRIKELAALLSRPSHPPDNHGD